MGMRGIVGALFFTLALCGNARAGASPNGLGNYLALTVFTCGDFVSRYRAEVSERGARPRGNTLFVPEFASIYHYVSGWLSSFNRMASDTYNIVPNGLDGAMLWLNNYCSANPLQSLDVGLQALITEAYPSRQQKPPGQ